jgi:CheY-like chemotaxis protein
MSHLGEKYRVTNILVADDDAVSRHFCCQVLARPGLRTLIAENGNAAICMAAEYVPDVVVMDSHLPDMRGEDAIALIHQRWFHSCDPPCFVGMTADDSPAAASRMQAAGCRSVLTKPFSAQALAACVRQACPVGPGERAFDPMPREPEACRQLQAKFSSSLAGQLKELDEALFRLDWATVQRLVHQLSGAAALAGYAEAAQSGRTLLRCLPPAGSAAMTGDSYLLFLQRLADIRTA